MMVSMLSLIVSTYYAQFLLYSHVHLVVSGVYLCVIKAIMN